MSLTLPVIPVSSIIPSCVWSSINQIMVLENLNDATDEGDQVFVSKEQVSLNKLNRKYHF